MVYREDKLKSVEAGMKSTGIGDYSDSEIIVSARLAPG
jgi:hypothetical protein